MTGNDTYRGMCDAVSYSNTVVLSMICPRVAHSAAVIIYLLSYLLTAWSRVLLDKPTGSQLVKKFPAIYGTRRFITAFTNARHLSLS